jgi:hypothetical protein
MSEVELQDGIAVEPPADKILAQLELVTHDDVFRSSRRSIAFLKYVIQETLNGCADQIKERTIGIEVFGRSSTYDTNLDHVVRTAATELRKRLAIYYGDEKHRGELRISMVPGSYIPRFTLPQKTGDIPTENGTVVDHPPIAGNGPSIPAAEPVPELIAEADHHPVAEVQARSKRLMLYLLAVVLLGIGLFAFAWFSKPSPEYIFWKPVLDTPGPVLLAVGDVPNGPPTLPETQGDGAASTPVFNSDSSQTVPFADMMTIARVVGSLEARKKTVLIRRENSSSFSDLREGAVVLIGAFNNEWSLRLTRQLRYSLALDAERHLIYIKDARNPGSRSWSWGTNQPRNRRTGANSPKLQDFALISRIWDSETGHVVVVIGGLYTYGTQAAGEFLTDPELMRAISKVAAGNGARQNLQIVLGTTVTDDTPGPPKVLATSTE